MRQMIRFAAAIGVLAVLFVASLVWAAEGPDRRSSEGPTANAARLAKGSVTSRTIRDNSIRLVDLRERLRDMLTGPGRRGRAGLDGEDGQDGDDGFDGEDGEDGVDGVSGYQVVREATEVAADQGSATDEVDCPGGKVVVGGGAVPASADPGVVLVVTQSGPQDDNSGWRASVARLQGGAAWTLTVQAICTNVTP
jgi:hypothetical protein